MWQRLKIPVTVLLLLAGAAYVVHKMARSGEWLEFRSDRFWQSVAQVRLSYLILAAALIFGSYFFRSLRWREFLAPLKSGNVGNIFVSTLIGFSAVALLGRPGELVRPLLIARKEGVTVSSQFGAWTLERIFDSLTVGIMIGAALWFFPPENGLGAGGARIMTHLKTGGLILCATALVLGTLLVILRNNPQVPVNALLWFAWALPKRHRSEFQRILGRVLDNFTATLVSIESVNSFVVCAAFSVLVWIAVILAYWAVTRAFGWPMNSLGLGGLMVLMGAAITGSLAQIPGVGGGTQLATGLVLTKLFGIPLEVASTAAILLWVLSFMIVLIPGLPLAAREGLSWQRLRYLAKNGA
jgi:uncharacterized protein (TIRG00374 family)